MPNVRDYLRKKAERKEKKPNTHNFGDLILKHRMAIITRTLLVLLLCAGLGATIYVQLKNQVFSRFSAWLFLHRLLYRPGSCRDKSR